MSGLLKQTVPETGLVDIEREAYDVLKRRANYSTIKLFDQSPAHYLHAIQGGGGDSDSDARKVGRATHLAIFEPDVYAKEVVTWRGGHRKGADWAAFRARRVKQEILTAAESEVVEGMAAGVRGNPDVLAYLAKGHAEITALWTDPATGVECKARLDWISSAGALIDLKTTRNASPAAFGRDAYRYRYFAQAAMYSDAVQVITGEELPFIIVAIENTAPYVVQPYVVSKEDIAAGRRLYRGWLEQLVACREADRWPGYADHPLALELPRWTTRTFERPDDAESET